MEPGEINLDFDTSETSLDDLRGLIVKELFACAETI